MKEEFKSIIETLTDMISARKELNRQYISAITKNENFASDEYYVYIRLQEKNDIGLKLLSSFMDTHEEILSTPEFLIEDDELKSLIESFDKLFKNYCELSHKGLDLCEKACKI